MKLPKLKKWHWVVLVLATLMLLGSIVPEQEPVEGAETTSPAVLLWIPVIALVIYLVLRSRKKKKAAIKAAKTKTTQCHFLSFGNFTSIPQLNVARRKI